jgi:hypothetical protein
MINQFIPSVIALVFGITPVGETETLAEAQEAAEAWLALIDSNQFSVSWDHAASLFQGAITQANWEYALNAARTPLGALQSRKLKSVTFTRTLPGAPDGEYVVIQYDSQFAKKNAAIETVTPMRDGDGQWKVAGYFIK